MKNLKIFCICLNNDLLEVVKNINYKPVGLGTENFSDEWIRDNNKKNISFKNKYYGEYSFHYWYWQNILENEIDGKWIGFCGYRRLWAKVNNIKIDYSNIKNHIIQTPPEI